MVAVVAAGWFGVASLVAAQAGPFEAVTLPAQVEAEAYDAGDAGVAWSDTDAHAGVGDFRTDDAVDAFVIERVGASGQTLLGRTRDGEFVQYTVEVAAADEFEVRLRVASGADAPGVIHVDIDGARVGTVDVDRTGWFAWETLSAGLVSLDPGSHVVRLTWDEGANINFDWLDFRSTTPQAAECASGVVEAEDATLAGRFVASYSFSASGDEAVGVERGTGGYFRGAGDSYVEFCTSVETAGEYRIDASLRAPTATKSSFFVSVDDGPLVEFVARATERDFETVIVNDARALDPLYAKEVPDLASVVDVATWDLEPGDHKVRFYLRRDGVQLDNMQFMPIDSPTCIVDGRVIPSRISQSSCDALIALRGDRPVLRGPLCSWPGVICQGSEVVEVFDDSLGASGTYYGKASTWIEIDGVVPSEIGNLTSLRNLSFVDEELTGFPPEIGNLTSLRSLSVFSSELSSLPPEIGDLSNLKRLYLRGNNLTSFPLEISGLTNLDTLGLLSSSLSSLPPEIGNLTNLTNLNVSSNKLTALPPEIGNLTNLTRLGAASNELSSFPPEIGRLTNLLVIDVDDNNLSSLPPEVGSLTNLRSLFVSDNNLSSLPPEIGSLSNFDSLYARNNNLTSLPGFLSSLDLDWVSLAGNQLRGDISVLAGGLADGRLTVRLGDGPGGNDCLTTTNQALVAVNATRRILVRRVVISIRCRVMR